MHPILNQQKFMCNRRVKLYEDWVELHTIKTKLDLLLDYESVLKDRKALMEKLAGTYDVDSKSLISLEIEQNDLKIEKILFGAGSRRNL